MKAVILDAASLGHDVDLGRLSEHVESLKRYEQTTPEEVLQRIQDKEIVIVNKVVLGASHFRQTPGLKLIAVTATGTNNIDLIAAKEQGVRVVNVIRYGRATVVQHTFSLILALSNSLLGYVADVKAGLWARSSNFCLMGHPIRELEGKTLGVIGYGDLGQGTAELGRAFGMKVIVGARPGSDSKQKADGMEKVSLAELLQHSDVISLHCLLSEQTQGMIGKKELGLMKSDAIIVNTSRGGLIDENALAEALRGGCIGGAATDVLSIEPPINGNPLLEEGIPNLIVTPHCAWASREARQRLVDLTAHNIGLFANNTLSRFVV